MNRIVITFCLLAIFVTLLPAPIRYPFLSNGGISNTLLEQSVEWLYDYKQDKKHTIYSSIPTKNQIGEGQIVFYSGITNQATMYILVGNNTFYITLSK